MRSRILGATIAAVTLMSSTGGLRAESLFQRLPEPGAWCRYDMIMLSQPKELPMALPEQTGRLTVSALDVVEHEGQPHQWIEIEFVIDVPDGTGNAETLSQTLIYKFLVQRDQLEEDGEPLEQIARGWKQMMEAEPVEADVANFGPAEPDALIVRFVFGDPLEDRSPVTIPKRLSLDEEELVSEQGFSGRMPATEVADGLEMEGEITMWTHDSAAFGVLAADFVYDAKISTTPEQTLEMQMAVQLELAETGDGAESKLPDQR